MRSTMSLGVSGPWLATRDVGSMDCARAIDAVIATQQSNDASTNEARVVRICASGQPKRDLDGGARIDSPPVRLRGFETNAEGRPCGRFVKAVAESAHDAQHADIAGGGEFEIQRHGAFDAGASRIVCVLR